MTPFDIPDWSEHIDALEPERPAGGEAAETVERAMLLTALAYDLALHERFEEVGDLLGAPLGAVSGEGHFLDWREWWRHGHAGLVFSTVSVR